MMTTNDLSSQKIKLLMIGDELKLLDGLNASMARAGYEVLTAHDANEGLILAKKYLPEIIICDVNGFQLKSILEKDVTTSAIPFIFLTSRSNQTDKIPVVKQEVEDCLTRPFTIYELLVRVQEILRKSFSLIIFYPGTSCGSSDFSRFLLSH
jgi:two-component system sensor histidine kinase/response regulator